MYTETTCDLDGDLPLLIMEMKARIPWRIWLQLFGSKLLLLIGCCSNSEKIVARIGMVMIMEQ